uniref:Uncharacterized protein n=1 Tax=Arundo donax TaxID=35708 RepID=A0A0A9B286_ARUDO
MTPSSFSIFLPAQPLCDLFLPSPSYRNSSIRALVSNELCKL